MRNADLYTHSHYSSDSDISPTQLVIKAGLVGMECPNSNILTAKKCKKAKSRENIIKIIKEIKTIAQQHDLILTSGSDYHGSIHPYNKLGDKNCDESIVIALKKLLTKNEL